MHHLRAQCHISQAAPEPKIGNFDWNLRVILREKDTVLTIRGSDMLSDALPLICIHPRKVMNYSSSNECMSLSHLVIFSTLIWSPKSVILSRIGVVVWVEKDTLVAIKGSCILSGSHPIILIQLRNIRKDSYSNGCMAFGQSVTFSLPIWSPKLVFLIEIWELFW